MNFFGYSRSSDPTILFRLSIYESTNYFFLLISPIFYRIYRLDSHSNDLIDSLFDHLLIGLDYILTLRYGATDYGHFARARPKFSGSF